MIKRRYGVNPTTIFNLAPLLFTLIAEGSLAWRRELLNEVREAADTLYGLSDTGGLDESVRTVGSISSVACGGRRA